MKFILWFLISDERCTGFANLNSSGCTLLMVSPSVVNFTYNQTAQIEVYKRAEQDTSTVGNKAFW